MYLHKLSFATHAIKIFLFVYLLKEPVGKKDLSSKFVAETK
jgi:hypothetical protein